MNKYIISLKPQGRHEASSTLRTYKYWVSQGKISRRGSRDLCTPALIADRLTGSTALRRQTNRAGTHH
jgi:hypothetical protein